jgi:hypothetical protein
MTLKSFMRQQLLWIRRHFVEGTRTHANPADAVDPALTLNFGA